MAVIWHHDGTGWALLLPVNFSDEDTLHLLIAQAPSYSPWPADRPLS